MKQLILLSCLTLAACAGSDAGVSTKSNGDGLAARKLAAWPPHQPGENPPPAPAEIEAVITQADALADMLPRALVASLFDPIAFGVTVRDLTDASLMGFHVRAVMAQQQGGCRPDSPYHCYGHPDYNDKVALIPVYFDNRYGTKLYAELVLPKRATVPPSAGPFPVILALQGLVTNTSVYRWWHQVYADAGYLVMALDFSGQGRSDDEVAGDPGNNVEEAQDALTWLFAESPVKDVLDAGRVGVVGHSQGAITTMALQAVEPRVHAAVAAAPISESMAPFDANPIPVMIQTGDHDGPVAPIPFVNPMVTRAVYEKLTQERAFIVAEASSHAQHTNYPLFPTASWGLEIAGLYSLAWMDYHLRGDIAALDILRAAHPHLSNLWDSEVQVAGETTTMRGAGPLPIP